MKYNNLLASLVIAVTIPSTITPRTTVSPQKPAINIVNNQHKKIANRRSNATKLSQYPYRSASVLLWYADRNNTEKFILADEAGGRDRGTYCDFGGKREKGENHPIMTAAHEFYEEAIIPNTLGWTLPQVEQFIDITKADNTKLINAYSNAITCHVTYLVDFTPYKDQLFKKFPHARKHAKKHHFREKNNLAIITKKDLINAIEQRTHRFWRRWFSLKVSALVQNQRTHKFEKKMITLRPAFVKSVSPYLLDKPYKQGLSKKIRFYNE